MPRKYQAKTSRKNGSHKPTTLPKKFQPGFLSTLDGRTDLARALKSNRDAIVSDLGGPEEMSHIKFGLVERVVWLQAVLETLEHDMATGTVDRDKALGQWIQAGNSWLGFCRTLGIERKQRTIDLKTYLVNGNNGDARTNGQATGAAT